MSDSDWYARHVGGGGQPVRPQATPPAPYLPPGGPPQGYQAPAGYVLVPVQQQGAPTYQAPPQTGYDQTAQYLAGMGINVGGSGHENPWAPVPPSPVDTSRIPKGTINPTNFLQLANFWRGREGVRAAEPCPRCHGVLFHRHERGMEAAPLCTSCGWNPKFTQGEYAHVPG
jgi:hypothetical protein